jgi:hypothetical protein
LDELAAATVSAMAVSGDPTGKAEADVAEAGWRFPVGYGMSIAQMQERGLYISEPRSPPETDRPFPEPALFAINPEDGCRSSTSRTHLLRGPTFPASWLDSS